jgi:hypothetical protein
MPDEGTVLLVESDPIELERLGRAIEDAGSQVIECPGPTAPDYTCIGGREGYCPLLGRADVTVLDTWLAGDELGVGTSSDELVEIYAASGRTVVALGAGGGRAPFVTGNVIHLDDRPSAAEVVASVRMAPSVDGFVLRGPLGR